MALRLILVRHGASAYADAGRYAGARDVPLSPVGERQAAQLAARLAGEPLAAILTSDLARAAATAEAIAARHALPALREPALRECGLGAWEGLTYAEAAARDPAAMAAWLRDPVTSAPPGGETVAALLARVLPVFARTLASHPEAGVLWVTHGGVIRCLLCHLLGMDPRRQWQFRCDEASLTRLYVDPAPASAATPDASGVPDAPPAVILTALNDTAHLR